jgi:hypothetical protein
MALNFRLNFLLRQFTHKAGVAIAGYQQESNAHLFYLIGSSPGQNTGNRSVGKVLAGQARPVWDGKTHVGRTLLSDAFDVDCDLD